MCDPECRKRFEAMERQLTSIVTDIKWFRWMIRTAIIGGGLFFGADLSGVV